uniref:Uncharacterized protein n=1 Tax=Romanomermis culicivorax TaxID=13658 RepID=A0A915HLQ6_ROMCU
MNNNVQIDYNWANGSRSDVWQPFDCKLTGFVRRYNLVVIIKKLTLPENWCNLMRQERKHVFYSYEYDFLQNA